MTLTRQRLSTIIGYATLVATALFVRVYYVLHSQPEIALRADAGQYFRIAINLVESGVYSTAFPGQGTPLPDSYRSPGYPTLIALPLALSGDIGAAYWTILLLQALLGAIGTLLVYRLGRQWMGRGWSLAAALIFAFWPHLIVQDASILTESVFGFLLLCAVFTMSGALSSNRLVSWIASGSVFGAAALVNSMIVPFALAVSAWTLIARERRSALIFAVLSLLPAAAWQARDAKIDRPEVKTAGGRLFENVLIGLEPDFKPSYRDKEDPRAAAARQRVAEGSTLYAHDRGKAYVWVFERISQNPLKYLLWCLRKPQLLWAWDVAQGAGDIYIYPMLYSPFEGNTFYRVDAAVCFGANAPLMVAAFCSVILLAFKVFRRRLDDLNRAALLLCGVMFLYANVLYAVLEPDARYANPFRAFEILLAISLVAHMALGFRKLRRSRTQSD